MMLHLRCRLIARIAFTGRPPLRRARRSQSGAFLSRWKTILQRRAIGQMIDTNTIESLVCCSWTVSKVWKQRGAQTWDSLRCGSYGCLRGVRSSERRHSVQFRRDQWLFSIQNSLAHVLLLYDRSFGLSHDQSVRQWTRNAIPSGIQRSLGHVRSDSIHLSRCSRRTLGNVVHQDQHSLVEVQEEESNRTIPTCWSDHLNCDHSVDLLSKSLFTMDNAWADPTS